METKKKCVSISNDQARVCISGDEISYGPTDKIWEEEKKTVINALKKEIELVEKDVGRDLSFDANNMVVGFDDLKDMLPSAPEGKILLSLTELKDKKGDLVGGNIAKAIGLVLDKSDGDKVKRFLPKTVTKKKLAK